MDTLTMLSNLVYEAARQTTSLDHPDEHIDNDVSPADAAHWLGKAADFIGKQARQI